VRFGRTGADAIYQAVYHICRLIVRFSAKIEALIAAAVVANVISPSDAVKAQALLAAATASCTVWQVLAKYSGF
jgi:hypothetical protein